MNQMIAQPIAAAALATKNSTRLSTEISGSKVLPRTFAYSIRIKYGIASD